MYIINVVDIEIEVECKFIKNLYLVVYFLDVRVYIFMFDYLVDDDVRNFVL